jgi:hypothetical protein
LNSYETKRSSTIEMLGACVHGTKDSRHEAQICEPARLHAAQRGDVRSMSSR